MTERKHKWAEVIKAWADGKPIQLKNQRGLNEWVDYEGEGYRIPPDFGSSYFEWRVKPEPVETYHFVEYMGEGDVEMYSSENLKANLRLTFEDKKLVKAEVIG